MNEELIRMVPKPVERPARVGAIFSSDLDLTPEKKRRPKFNDSRVRSKPKIKSPINKPVQVENHENMEKLKSFSSLGQPTINSSARISCKLQELQESKFNPEIAIAEELENSETARTNFAEKVASAVNVRRDQNKYSDLISLDVAPNDIISSHTQQRVPLKGKIQDNGPQIMDFFSDDFEEENATFHIDLLDEEEEIPTILHEHAFDLHSHMACWEHRWK